MFILNCTIKTLLLCVHKTRCQSNVYSHPMLQELAYMPLKLLTVTFFTVCRPTFG